MAIMPTIFCACNLQSNKKTDSELSELDKYEIAYKEASNSTITLDTIFLGLRFGMTQKEVDDHLRKMQDSRNSSAHISRRCASTRPSRWWD